MSLIILEISCEVLISRIDEVITLDGIFQWLYSEEYDAMFEALDVLMHSTSVVNQEKYQLLKKLIQKVLLLFVLKEKNDPPFIDLSAELDNVQREILRLEERYKMTVSKTFEFK